MSRATRNFIIFIFSSYIIILLILFRGIENIVSPIVPGSKNPITEPKIKRPVRVTSNRKIHIETKEVTYSIKKRLGFKKPILKTEDLKIDWHDYTFIRKEKLRTGTGEQGAAVYFRPKNDKAYNTLYAENGFNGALSDKISIERAIPDTRHTGCHAKKYLKNLGTVSIIIPFHNEHWSTLLRTLYSIINRSPFQLLREIIIVDDFSTKEFLKKSLDDYVQEKLPKVHILRLPKRQGLIAARMVGAKFASSDILVFLDSHTEVNVNWLPPLLEPIAQDYRTCVCPLVEVISFDTFQYEGLSHGSRGAFNWKFYYTRLPLLSGDKMKPAEPFRNPIMMGGYFAISSKFFWELGGYDELLDIWGGEQYELSFKIWQCGGQLLDIPCSRVGHIFRKSPFPSARTYDYLAKNFKRVAEVWMDEYAQYLYKRRPDIKNIDPGDLSKQKALREKLKCKNFKWYMEKIAFDFPKFFPLVEPPDFAYGEIRNLGAPDLCIDSAREQLSIIPCAENPRKRSGSQNFTLTWHKDIRTNDGRKCWDVSDFNLKANVKLLRCHEAGGNQYWKYNPKNHLFYQGKNTRCLDCDPGKKSLYVTMCNENSETQKWKFETVNLTAFANWDSIGPR